MLTICTEPGCTTLVMGGRCVEHEPSQTRLFVRGRPFKQLAGARGPDIRRSSRSLFEIAGDEEQRALVLAVVGSDRRSVSHADA
jgi:hypothetical protein